MDEVTADAQAMYEEYPFGRFGYGREKFNPALLAFLERVGAQDRVFDVGCGAGFWMDAYLRAGVTKEHITGVDLSPTNCEKLRERGFRAVCGDVQNLELEDDVSDFTVCAGVIHHAPDPLRAFQELVRITRPGGRIFLGVYNQWNPYYYLVHRATLPLRWIYWHRTRRILDVVYPLSKVVFQPLALLVFGRFLDDETGRALFMDQVMTPRAHLFSRGRIRSWAEAAGCSVEDLRFVRYFTMIEAVLRVGRRG